MCHSVRKPSSSDKLLPSKGRYHDAADVACLPLLLLQQSGYCGRSLSGHLHGHDLSSSISVNAARSCSQSQRSRCSARRCNICRLPLSSKHVLCFWLFFWYISYDDDESVVLSQSWPLPSQQRLAEMSSYRLTRLDRRVLGWHRSKYRCFYTRTHAFTHKRFYTQTLLHTDPFTQTKASIAIFPQFLTSNVHFVRKGCDWISKIAIFPQFLTSNVHFVCKGYNWQLKVAFFPQFLTSNVHFVRKGCAGRFKVAIFPQFLTSNVHFVRKGCRGRFKIAILPRFWTSNVHFVRKGCVSWRSGGTAPALRENRRRARGDLQVWRCEDLDLQVWG